MLDILTLGIGSVAYLTLRSIIGKTTITVDVAYAGSPDCGKPNTRNIPLPKNNPIYKDGDVEVDVSKLTPLIIEGLSLEPLGIKNQSTIFVQPEPEQLPDESLEKLIGRFVVYKIDNERTLKEHPLKNISVNNGFKARKVVNIVNTKLDNIQIEQIIHDFLKKDLDFQNSTDEEQKAFLDKIVGKYLFASNYYTNDNKLIMSITYKSGKEKDYSFHSPQFLYGVVKYNSI